MSTQIRAAVLRDQPGKLSIEHVTIDNPEADEVLVEVAYAGLCHSDLHEIDGTFATQLPIVLGHEVSGHIVATGANVCDLRTGDRVVTCLSVSCGTCARCASGRHTLCSERDRLTQQRAQPRLRDGSGQPVRATAGIGGFAEFVLVHRNAVAVVPDTVRLSTASILGCAVTTGAGAVIRTAGVRPGDRVAVIGLGGVGIAAIQAARLSGAVQIVAVDVVPWKLALAARFGASHSVDARQGDPVVQVLQLTDGGVDHALEAVGAAATVEQAFRMLCPGGTATVMGMVPEDQPITISGSDLFVSEKRLQGSFMGSNNFRTDIPHYVDQAALGRLDLDAMVTASVGLTDINDGFDLLARGEAVRVVAEIGGDRA